MRGCGVGAATLGKGLAGATAGTAAASGLSGACAHAPSARLAISAMVLIRFMGWLSSAAATEKIAAMRCAGAFILSYLLSYILGIFDAYHKATRRRATHLQPFMNPADPALTVCARGLSRRFGTHIAVNALDLELRRGEVLGLLGPNGAGKTTTMQMLTGNLAPSTGAIRICDIDLLEAPVLAKARIGYLPETPPLYRELNVGEYLHLAARLHRVAKAQRAAAVALAMQRCGLAAVGKKLIGALSKGYQQRVGIAQAIVHEPDVVILDEPTVGLDPNQILDIRALIRELGDKHSVILSTHILPEVEAVCDRVQIMHHGDVVFSNTIAGLRDFQRGRTVTAQPAPAARDQHIARNRRHRRGGSRGRRPLPHPLCAGRGPDRRAGQPRGRRRLGPARTDAGTNQP